MPTIDLGSGQTIDRARVPAHMLKSYDQANAAVTSATSDIRNWAKPLTAMQAPATFSGQIHCNAVGLSGYVYNLPETGGAILVDQRDLPFFTNTKMNFTAVPSGNTAGRPATGLRVGLVYNDTQVGSYVRWDGAAWNPVTLT